MGSVSVCPGKSRVRRAGPVGAAPSGRLGSVHPVAGTQLVQCEPQDVAGLGPRRPRRAFGRSEPQGVAGLGPRRPRRAIRKTCGRDSGGERSPAGRKPPRRHPPDLASVAR